MRRSSSVDTEGAGKRRAKARERILECDIPERKPGHGDIRFWIDRYAANTSPLEWYLSWSLLESTLESIIKQCDSCLYVGCGTSQLGVDMLSCGLNKVLNIDISQDVIDAMSRRFVDRRVGWEVHNILESRIPSRSFDMVLDKGTLDALMCSDNNESVAYTMMAEVVRLLKPSGFFVCVSRCPEDMRRFLFEQEGLNISLKEVTRISTKQFPTVFYNVFILKKSL